MFWVLDSGGRLYAWNLMVNPFGPVAEVGNELGGRLRRDDMSELIDIVLCGDRSRGSLISLCLSGEMAVRQLEATQTRFMNDTEIEKLIQQVNDLTNFI